MDELLLERLVVAVELLAKETAETRAEQRQAREEQKKFIDKSQGEATQKTTEMVQNIMGVIGGGKS